MKAVISRNFLGKTLAKYCVAKYGSDPSSAVEVDEFSAEDVQFLHVTKDRNLTQFENFGCGIVAVGEVDAAMFGGDVIHFNGVRFVNARGQGVNGAQLIKFERDEIKAEGILTS